MEWRQFQPFGQVRYAGGSDEHQRAETVAPGTVYSEHKRGRRETPPSTYITSAS